MTNTQTSDALDSKKVYVDVSFSDIVPWFLDNRKEDIKRLKEFVDVGDYEQIQRMGHRWKGTCSSYGFRELSEAGELFEVLGATQSQNEMRGLIERISDYISHVEVIYVSPSENTNSSDSLF